MVLVAFGPPILTVALGLLDFLSVDDDDEGPAAIEFANDGKMEFVATGNREEAAIDELLRVIPDFLWRNG
jgi:hypothetical protein